MTSHLTPSRMDSMEHARRNGNVRHLKPHDDDVTGCGALRCRAAVQCNATHMATYLVWEPWRAAPYGEPLGLQMRIHAPKWGFGISPLSGIHPPLLLHQLECKILPLEVSYTLWEWTLPILCWRKTPFFDSLPFRGVERRHGDFNDKKTRG